MSAEGDPFDRIKAAAAAPAPAKAASADGELLSPVPDNAPPLPARWARLGEPSHAWAYRDAAGRVLRYVLRFPQAAAEKGEAGLPRERWTDKTIRSATLWRTAEGVRWTLKAEPGLRPLYNQDQLAARPAAPVLLTEGEKDADAAAERFPACVAATWPGGSNAVSKADFSPLCGRGVVIWGDADEPGRKAAQAAAKAASAAGALSVAVVEPPAFFPAGWGLADPWPDGFDQAAASALIEAARASAQPIGIEWPWGFSMTPEGLVYEQPAQGGGQPIPTRISGPFDVLAEGRDVEGGGWSVLVRFRDRDGREHTIAVPKGRLASGGAEVRADLADAGLMISPARGKSDKFAVALTEVRVSRRVTLVSATGWCGERYVLPREVIGPIGAEAVHYTAESAGVHYRRAGSLAGWRASVASWAQGNDLMTFCLSLAFLGPLLRPLDWEGGGVHLRGGSSCGKSTLQLAAGSVWGGGGTKGFVHDWRMTGNALEMLAYSHNDNVLVLDELKQIAAEEAGAAAYMLASGQAKARARADGSLRRRAEWRVFVLSSGELSLSDHVASSRKGERAYAGQELRLLDIAADLGLRNADGSSMGVWQQLHGRGSSWEVSAKRDYGHAGPAFLAALTAQREQALAQAAELRGAFLQSVAQEGDTGQARRGAEKFAAAAAAGELAVILGVLPWPVGMAMEAARRLYHRWAAGFGRDRSREAFALLRRVKAVIESEGASFAPWDEDEEYEAAGPSRAGRDEQARGLKSWGYRAVVGGRLEFRFNSAGWAYVTEGLGRAEAAKALHEAGFLEKGEGDHMAKRYKRRGVGMRLYTVKGEILEADLGD